MECSLDITWSTPRSPVNCTLSTEADSTDASFFLDDIQQGLNSLASDQGVDLQHTSIIHTLV